MAEQCECGHPRDYHLRDRLLCFGDEGDCPCAEYTPLPRLADAALNVLSDIWYWLRRGWSGGAYATPSEPEAELSGPKDGSLGTTRSEVRSAITSGSLGAAAAPETGRALDRMQAWLDDIQLSNRLGFPTYANPGELQADLRVLLAALRDADADRDKLERALGEARDEAFGLRGRALAAEARLRRALAASGGEAKAGR